MLCLAVFTASLAYALPGCGGSEQTTAPPAVSATGASQAQAGGAEARVIFERSDNSKIQGDDNREDPFLIVEVARTTQQQARGLMQRDSLAADHGMIFVYQGTVTTAFWMKNTYIPLSIAFVSSEHRIVDIQDMDPRSEVLHHPAQPYRYAIEANRGFYENNGIRVGDSIRLEGI